MTRTILPFLIIVSLIVVGCGNASTPRSPLEAVDHNAKWTPVFQDFEGIKMALVPVGCFVMGVDRPSRPSEQPAHKQCLDKPFWIDVNEVTNAQYGSSGYASGDLKPRETVSWFDALAHCNKRAARLPTEAEWEYAAQGPDDLIFPWGNDFVPENLVYAEMPGGQMPPESVDVGSRPGGVSWVGAMDVSGNVWEWTSSIFKPYPYDRADGRENVNDPSSKRVTRGGSFINGSSAIGDAFLLETWARNELDPAKTYLNVGFRCVRDY